MYQGLSMHHDWCVQKSIVNLPIRPGLLDAWLVLTSVKYHRNLYILIPLNQRLELTRLRATGLRLKGNLNCSSTNLFSPLGSLNNNINTALQTLLTWFRLRLYHRLLLLHYFHVIHSYIHRSYPLITCHKFG